MSQQTLTLQVNGREQALPASGRLLDLLDALGVDRRLIAIAHNGDVVPRATYEDIVLRPGDRVEVVRMVGGG